MEVERYARGAARRAAGPTRPAAGARRARGAPLATDATTGTGPDLMPDLRLRFVTRYDPAPRFYILTNDIYTCNVARTAGNRRTARARMPDGLVGARRDGYRKHGRCGIATDRARVDCPQFEIDLFT
jgi:hypothetical protein